MKSNPNKSVDKYIEHGEMILRTDSKNMDEHNPWALVDTMRGLLHTRLSQLKVKTKILNELNEKFHDNTVQKADVILKIKNDILKLKVFIENAYYFDAERLFSKLSIDRPLPIDEAGLLQYVKDLVGAIGRYDEQRFPLPVEYTQQVDSYIAEMELLIEKSRDFRQKREVLVKNREMALDQFREIIPPIRRWLWKMLPEGRMDERLYEYGFKPYGK